MSRLLNIGCGAALPTIIARHSLANESSWMSNAANSEVFMTAEAHFVDLTPPMETMVDPGPYTSFGGFQYMLGGWNWQEASLGGPTGGHCSNPATQDDGRCMHTGLAWWTVVRVVPATNRIYVQARSPWFGGAATSHLPALYVNGPAVGVSGQKEVVFSPSLCTRFPGMTGC